MNSRPPLRLDMAGPTPCTYSTIPPPSAANGILINPKTKHKRGQYSSHMCVILFIIILLA